MVEKPTGGPQPLARIAEAHAYEVARTRTAGLPIHRAMPLSFW